MATLGAIDRFRVSVLKDGVARPSKYEVRITPPENIKNVLISLYFVFIFIEFVVSIYVVSVYIIT